MDDVSLNDLNLIEIIQLGSKDKGEVSTEGKYKVRNELWFQSKKGILPRVIWAMQLMTTVVINWMLSGTL